MQAHELRNRIRTLFCIEGFELPELSIDQQAQFVGDPVGYFLASSDEQASAIMREVEERQTDRAPRKKRRKSRVREQGELLLPISGTKAETKPEVAAISFSMRKQAG